MVYKEKLANFSPYHPIAFFFHRNFEINKTTLESYVRTEHKL